MNKVKNVFLGILKFILKSIYYACFALGAFYFVGAICFLSGISDFDFEIFTNSNPEELKIMLRVMIRAFYILGITFTMLEYSYKYFSSESYEISYHKLKPLMKAKEIRRKK